MRVLLADKLPDQARVRLAAGGCEVRAEPGLSGDALVEALAAFDPEVLIVRSTKVLGAHLTAAPSLSLVIRAGAGVNTIDLDTASRHGIFVSNCPGKNAVAVAELTLGLLLACDRRIPDATADLRAGRWDKKTYGAADGLKGRTFGILGMGAIGEEVATRAQAFGMEVLAWSRSLTDARAAELGVRRYETPEDVARRSNVLSVHLALTPETRGLVGESIFRELKHGAIFLNTSRAEVVDEDALRDALDTKGLRAGLDVFSSEPAASAGSFDHPLAKHPSVVGTHHVGASTNQAQEAVADEACRIVETFRATGTVPNCVNLAVRPRARYLLVVRHLDRVGVLASVLTALREADINVGQMENLLFENGDGAIARIRVHGRPSDDALAAMRASENVLSVTLVDLGKEA